MLFEGILWEEQAWSLIQSSRGRVSGLPEDAESIDDITAIMLTLIGGTSKNRRGKTRIIRRVKFQRNLSEFICISYGGGDIRDVIKYYMHSC